MPATDEFPVYWQEKATLVYHEDPKCPVLLSVPPGGCGVWAGQKPPEGDPCMFCVGKSDGH